MLSVWNVAPYGYTRQPEGWREQGGLGPKEGSNQQITHRYITTLISDTHGLSYSNYGNWEAVSFGRFPILTVPYINGINVEYISKYYPLSERKNKEKKVLCCCYCCFLQKTLFAIILKKVILHHGYLYTCTSFGKIFYTQNLLWLHLRKHLLSFYPTKLDATK